VPLQLKLRLANQPWQEVSPHSKAAPLQLPMEHVLLPHEPQAGALFAQPPPHAGAEIAPQTRLRSGIRPQNLSRPGSAGRIASLGTARFRAAS
jgi:hypothetical protein